MARVMLVGVEGKDNLRIQEYFRTVGVPCEAMPSMEKAIERIPTDPPTLVITEKPDVLDTLTGLQYVLKTNAPATPFLVLMPKESIPEALSAMNMGAYDCVARPLNKLNVLAASKRAAMASGRTLFGTRVRADKRPWGMIVGAILLALGFGGWFKAQYEGPPPITVNLASATLAGIQWEDRSLWVANWFDSTVTHYDLGKSFLRKNRAFTTNEMFRMQDSQPILVCNTPDALVTVAFDLKMRVHQRILGLPTLQSLPTPGGNPTGLAWDGSNLWSSDGLTGMLYKHSPDLRVIQSVKSLIPTPSGIAFDGKSMWVVGGTPLSLAKMEEKGGGFVWSGPYDASDLLTAGLSPSGMSIAFGRIWMVSGGSPWMTSKSIKKLTEQTKGWPKPTKMKKKKAEPAPEKKKK